MEPISPLSKKMEAEKLLPKSCSLLLSGIGGLCFGGTSDFLDSSFDVFELLSGLGLGAFVEAVSLEEGLLIELLSEIDGVVDEGET